MAIDRLLGVEGSVIRHRLMRRDEIAMKTLMKSTTYSFRRLLVVGGVWLLPLLWFWCSAATLTVGPFGDKNYMLIGDAVKAAAANDIVEVYPGQYDEPTIELDKTITVRGKYDPIQQRVIGSGDGFSITAGHPILEALTVTRSGNGVTLSGAYAKCTIRNCLVLANGENGVETTFNQPCFILNCVLGYNKGSGVVDTFGMIGTKPVYTVANTLLIGNAEYGASVVGFFSGPATVDYSLFFDNHQGVASDSDLLGSHVQQAVNPKFRDVDRQDFRLQADSAAVNAGDPSPGSQDPDGTRNDIGVYGGPYARSFWYGPGPGPTVRDLVAIPPVVKYGRTFRVEGKAQVEPTP